MKFHNYLLGVPKKCSLSPFFSFRHWKECFRGENNSKNFGNKKNIRLSSKILRKWTLFVRKMKKIMWIFEFMAMLRMEIFFKWHKSQLLCRCKYDYWILWHLKIVFHSCLGYKLIKTPKFLHYFYKQCQYTQNFAKQPYILFVPKVLRIIFYP